MLKFSHVGAYVLIWLVIVFVGKLVCLNHADEALYLSDKGKKIISKDERTKVEKELGVNR